ncbi:hypothetical protein KBC75_00180 [Candidatus Shapirobacteria bacterium]|nr:hypothetical protein [Candidatus Shapirobacteria bacterium]
MKKYILPSLLVLGVLCGYLIYRRPTMFRRAEPQVSSDSINKLPAGWSAVEAKNVALKLEKNTSGIKPQIVKTINQSSEATAPAKYTDSLIAGATSAIPSLTITDDKRKSSENLYTANLSGYYYNQKVKISLIQRIKIQKDQVSVLTASFTGDLNTEINSILDNL